MIRVLLLFAIFACNKSPSPAPTPAPASALAIAPEPAPASAPESASAPASAAAPVPSVNVANIGMHIGGGPNDPATKEPIAKSVEPYFDDLRRCYPLVDEKRRASGGDYGVDLRIEKDGGLAQVSHPRTVLGKAFEECV